MSAVEPLPLLRPARPDDLETLITFAREAGPGITSLPNNPVLLEEKLRPHIGGFLFCLEIDGEVVGTSGIVSRIGSETPFFAYHLRYERHYSHHLKIDREMPILHFLRAQKKPTELGTLYMKKEWRGQGLASLLSLGRLLFIASFRDRFAETIIAELRGVNREGNAPFYEAIGHHFLEVSFHEADLLRTSHPECIEELFPTYPIYTTLLPTQAQEAIGEAHPNTIPAKKLLEKQGFKGSDYCDILDAGPHVWAETDQIHAVRESREGEVSEIRPDCDGGKRALVAKITQDFRVCATEIYLKDQGIVIAKQVAERLQLSVGERVRYYWV